MMEVGSDKWQNVLESGARELGVVLSQEGLRQMAWHARELLRWNRRKNLTRITDPMALLVKHYLDALSVVPLLPERGRLLDIGSGGGFPGIPIRISAADLEIQLIEASQKKVHFLKHVIRTLNLHEIRADHIRAEDLAAPGPSLQRFDVVISRAVSSLKAFYHLAKPLVADSGVIIAMKSKALPEEMRSFHPHASSGGDINEGCPPPFHISVEHVRFPLMDLERFIVMIR